MEVRNIKNAIYGNNEIIALYLGDNLLYQKEVIVTPNNFVGKFSDDSTESDWYFTINSSKKINLPVDSETKTFDFNYTDELKYLYNSFMNSKIESLQHFPNTSNVTNMGYMFNGCHKLTELDLSSFDTSNVTEMGSMFSGCSNLTELDLSSFDTSNVTNMGSMFSNCDKLTSIIFNQVNFSNKTNLNYIFYYCSKLTDITGEIIGIKDDLELKQSPLTNSSAMVFINGLSEVEETKKITFKRTTYDELTEEQIALATSKGWSVVRY